MTGMARTRMLENTTDPLLTFDPATERFTGEHAEAANLLVKDKTLPGFVIPEINAV